LYKWEAQAAHGTPLQTHPSQSTSAAVFPHSLEGGSFRPFSIGLQYPA
jgi:hypothetical protein